VNAESFRGQLEELETLAHTYKEQTDTLQVQLKDLRLSGERLHQEIRQSHQQEEVARATQRNADLALEKARRGLQWQQENGTRLEVELKQAEADSANIEKELAELEQEDQQARQELRERSAQLEEHSLEEIQTELAHWNMRAAVAERAESDAKIRLKERQSAQENALRGARINNPAWRKAKT
jgi:chromosome segregation ATPase